MPRSFVTSIQMNQLEILGLRLEQVAGNPSTPVEGRFWYDSTAKRVKYQDDVGVKSLVRDGGDLTAGSVAIAALATNPLARANHTGTQTAATISDFDTQVRTSRLDQMAAPTAAVSLNSQRITNLGAPTAASDAATRQYVDDSVAGLSWKNEVRVATTGPGTLASSFANGSTIDGVTLVTGDRILIKDQAAPAENGIYTVNASGAPTRATDADTGAEMSGAAVFVQSGTANNGTRWVCNVSGTITLGTTGVTFVQFGGGSAYTAGNGLTLTSNDFNVGAGTGISVGADTVSIDTAVVVRKFVQAIGNGSLTTITVTHNLGNRDVQVQVVDTATYSTVECDVVRSDTNNVALTFAVAPTTNQYRCIVQG